MILKPLRLIKSQVTYLSNSHKELPPALQQSEIYRIYTIDMANTKTVMQHFGNHIVASETIELELKVFNLKAFLENFNMKKTIKTALKALKITNVTGWAIFLISIKIYMMSF